MTVTIQLIEESTTFQEFINLDDNSLNKQIVTHTDEIIALNYTAQHQPEMILLSYAVRDLDTSEFLGFLLGKSPKSKIIVIGNQLSQEQVLSCLLAGANGYINQSSEAGLKILNKAIHAVLNHEIWITRKMTAILLERLRSL